MQKEHNFEYYFKNKNIFFSTSGVSDPEVALFAIRKIGIDNIPISDEDKDKIFYKNAEKNILKVINDGCDPLL